MAGGILLITGPHQAGKTRALWRRLRGEPPGAAVLVRPAPGLPRELVAQAVAWDGPGLLPPAIAWAALVERLAATVEALPAPLPAGVLRHRLRPWCGAGLAASPWAALAPFRCAADGLAELLERLDDHRVGDDTLAAAAAAARAEDPGLADALQAVARARRWQREDGRRRGTAGPAARLAALAAADPAPPWAALYLDDFLGFTPAELALVAALARRRRVVISAVDDPRLGRGGAAERLRAAFPAAEEERLAEIAGAAPHTAARRTALARLAGEEPLPAAAVPGLYHYRDEVHAGRAIAAWLRRHGIAPAEAALFVRSADHRALALADALAAAGVAVEGRFSVPFAGTAAGAALGGLGRLLARPRWDLLLAVLGRLALLGHAPPPVPLAGLVGPWAARAPDEALAELRGGGAGTWRWAGEAGDLAALCDWLERGWRQLAADGSGGWAERVAAAVRRLDLGPEAAAAAADLLLLDAHHPAGPDDLDELIAGRSLAVERQGGPQALVLHDALRGRAGVRRLAIVHGLEHGAWPRAPRPSPLFTAERRTALARLLERDVYDEEGRAAGELAAFLAVAARGAQGLLLGVPCGDREPSAWLAAILAQSGRDVEQERAAAARDAIPGAPLGPGDSQGAGEAALWVAPAAAPRSFRVPPRPAAGLHLRPSELNHLADDAFALLCDRLRLSHPLADAAASLRGSELHALVAALAAHPPAAWSGLLPGLLAGWTRAAADPFQRAAREREGVALAVTIERELAGGDQSWAPLTGARVESEHPLTVTLPLPDGALLPLRGRADRIDHLADGTLRVVDWKTRVANRGFREAIRAGTEGQLAAYAAALAADGQAVSAAGYVGLLDGLRAAWPPGADWAAVLRRLGAALAHWSAGRVAAADRSGRDYPALARSGEWADADGDGAEPGPDAAEG